MVDFWIKILCTRGHLSVELHTCLVSFGVTASCHILVSVVMVTIITTVNTHLCTLTSFSVRQLFEKHPEILCSVCFDLSARWVSKQPACDRRLLIPTSICVLVSEVGARSVLTDVPVVRGTLISAPDGWIMLKNVPIHSLTPWTQQEWWSAVVSLLVDAEGRPQGRHVKEDELTGAPLNWDACRKYVLNWETFITDNNVMSLYVVESYNYSYDSSFLFSLSSLLGHFQLLVFWE